MSMARWRSWSLGLLTEGGGEVDLAEIAAQLQLSADSVAFLLVGLAREGKVSLKVSAPLAGEE